MDIGTISAGLAGLKGTIDIVKLAISARDYIKAQDAIAQANERFIQLSTAASAIQEKNAALAEENAALRDEKRKRGNFEAQIAEYREERLPAGGRCLVRDARVNEGKPAMYLCINCAARGEITYLQETDKGGHELACHVHGRIRANEYRPRIV